MYLLISDVIEFLDASPASRNFIEGEKILNAGHLLSCGVTDKTGSSLSICSLCLQTSKLSSAPHEIKGNLQIKDTKLAIMKMECSCKAGLGQRCKHIAASLMYCTRNNVGKLEQISKTDLKCLWSQKKTKDQLYAPQPLLETPCLLAHKSNESNLLLTEADKNYVFQTLVNILPDSGLAQYSSDERKIKLVTNILVVHSATELRHQKLCKVLLLSAAKSDLMENLYRLDFPSNLKQCCVETYNQFFPCMDNFKVCEETKADKNVWKETRKFRVTGSRCYSLYTYSKNEWEKKAQQYFWPKEISNRFLRHGLEFESIARGLYERKCNVTVEEFGLVVCQKNPWLGFSPDGVIFQGGFPHKLIEIKCPYRGKLLSLTDVLSDCKYIFESGRILQLKQKHSYYGQVQLGMAILNLRECDFVIYCSKDNDIKIISVQLNVLFVKKLLYKLKTIFFDKMLHVLCKHQ